MEEEAVNETSFCSSISYNPQNHKEGKEEMKPFTCFIVLVALCIASSQTLAGPTTAIGALRKACEQTESTELCISTLQSDPISYQSNLTGLALVALKKASENASDVSEHLKILKNDPTLAESEYSQSLFDCFDLYVDSSQLLDSSIAALLANAYGDVKKWVGVAVTNAQTCESSFGATPSVMSQKNQVFVQLCKVAISLTALLGRR